MSIFTATVVPIRGGQFRNSSIVVTVIRLWKVLAISLVIPMFSKIVWAKEYSAGTPLLPCDVIAGRVTDANPFLGLTGTSTRCQSVIPRYPRFSIRSLLDPVDGVVDLFQDRMEALSTLL